MTIYRITCDNFSFISLSLTPSHFFNVCDRFIYLSVFFSKNVLMFSMFFIVFSHVLSFSFSFDLFFLSSLCFLRLFS